MKKGFKSRQKAVGDKFYSPLNETDQKVKMKYKFFG
jgi:hypothetical protein